MVKPTPVSGTQRLIVLSPVLNDLIKILKTLRASLVIPLFFGAYFSAAVTTLACKCEENFTPPCASYWRADALFIGEVQSIESRKMIGASPTGFATVQVKKRYKGID